jgi:hypothetical protein
MDRASATRCSTSRTLTPDPGDRLADQRRPCRVEVRGRLVEQQQPWARRQRTGQREALLLAAGQRVGAPSAAVAEADPGERLVDPGPDLRGRHAAVLQAERYIVAGPS